MLRLITLGLLLAPALAQADELQRCAQIADATPRLACYDALAQRLRSAPPVAVAPVAVPAAAPTAAQKLEAFGAPVVAAKDQLDAIESRIDAYVDGWEAGTVFQLANGQRWMIADGTRAVMELRKPKVRIRRGAMGTFRIEFEGSNQTARVERL